VPVPLGPLFLWYGERLVKSKRKDDREGEGTKFTLDRKIFSSDIWYASPWKLKIWIYLIGHANHKDNSFMGIPLKRGQLIRSYRRIAKDCAYKVGYRVKKPSLDTVKTICDELRREGRTEQRSVHKGTLFTVCNYNDLQRFPKPRTERRSEHLTEQDKNDSNKEHMLKCFERFWEEYPKKVGKKVAKEKFLRLSLDEKKFQEIMRVLRIYRETREWIKDGGQFIPHPATWINQERWNDEVKPTREDEPMLDYIDQPVE